MPENQQNQPEPNEKDRKTNEPDKETEEEKPEEIEFKKDFEFFPGTNHIYRQEGPYLVCRGCQLSHALYVGMDKIMVGEDQEGRPIVKNRSEVMKLAPN